MPNRFPILLLAASLGCVMTPDRPPTPDRRVFLVSDESIDALQGEEFEIRLGANNTTGFQWRMVRAPGNVSVIAERYESDIETTGRVGADGAAVFILRADAAGAGTLGFEYARPWETGPDRETDRKSFEVRVR